MIKANNKICKSLVKQIQNIVIQTLESLPE